MSDNKYSSSFQIIPAIDLLDGQVVRLSQGKYEDVTNYDVAPEVLAKMLEDVGAKKLHIVDLNGAKSGDLANLETIKKIRKSTSLNIQLGGGIRSQDSCQSYFDIGISQCIIGSVLVKNFTLAKQIIEQYPNQIIAGVDALSNNVAIQGWTEKTKLTVDELVHQINELPIHSIIYTDISKDGMMSGPDFKGLSTYPKKSKAPFVASGGIRNIDDVKKLKNIPNICGCIIGKAILSNLNQLPDFFSRS